MLVADGLGSQWRWLRHSDVGWRIHSAISLQHFTTGDCYFGHPRWIWAFGAGWSGSLEVTYTSLAYQKAFVSTRLLLWWRQAIHLAWPKTMTFVFAKDEKSGASSIFKHLWGLPEEHGNHIKSWIAHSFFLAHQCTSRHVLPLFTVQVAVRYSLFTCHVGIDVECHHAAAHSWLHVDAADDSHLGQHAEASNRMCWFWQWHATRYYPSSATRLYDRCFPMLLTRLNVLYFPPFPCWGLKLGQCMRPLLSGAAAESTCWTRSSAGKVKRSTGCTWTFPPSSMRLKIPR